MTDSEFQSIRQSWTDMNALYDERIMLFLNDPENTHFTEAERLENTGLQAKLADLEETIQAIEAGTIAIENN